MKQFRTDICRGVEGGAPIIKVVIERGGVAHHVRVLVWVRHTDFSQLDVQVLKCKGCYVIVLMRTDTLLIQWNAVIHMTTLNWMNSTIDKGKSC